ncbi:MAG: BON domain-containing protein [Armatimonadota bacterium]
MKTLPIVLATATLAALVLVGCGNTAEGLKEDANKNAQNAGPAIKDMGEKAGEGLKDLGQKSGEAVKGAGGKIGDATSKAPEAAKQAGDNIGAKALGAQIKAAFVANPITNSPDVGIDVDADTNAVNLKGHVGTQEQKDEAERIAKEILKKNKANQLFSSTIEVKKADTK